MDRAGPQRTAIYRLTVYSMLNLIRGEMALAGLRHVHMRMHMHMWGDIGKKADIDYFADIGVMYGAGSPHIIH